MVEKYHICSVQTLYAWVGKYVSQENLLSLQKQTSEDIANRSKDDQIRELKAALRKAQKEAKLERLSAKAYDKMIDLAEERFNIPIRKKSGTKQYACYGKSVQKLVSALLLGYLVIAGNHYHKYENLVKDVVPTRPNEIWVRTLPMCKRKKVYVICRSSRMHTCT